MHAIYMDATHCYEHTVINHNNKTLKTPETYCLKTVIIQRCINVRCSVMSTVFQSAPSSAIVEIMYHYKTDTT